MKSIIEAYQKILRQSTDNVEIVTETTVPEELQHIPESWDHHSQVSDETYAKMKAALKHGSFTHFPLESASLDADPDVIEHLTKHGYEVKDYRAGTATIKKTVGDPSRGIPLREKHVEEKIGSVLEKTNASPEVKSSFMNDPSRAASKSQHHVVIATSPLAIAGMTTGTAWRDQSCMNIATGAYKHKLKDDSEHGTHVAFLVPHDDATAFKYGEPSKPIARIALKPFHGPNGDTIFRPENKTYGADNTAFTKAVGHWASENYPAQPGHTYTKNMHVYDDTGNDEYHALSKDEIEHAVENANTFSNRTAIDHHMIDHALAHAEKHFGTHDEETRSREHARAILGMSFIPNLTTSHVAKMNRQLENLPNVGKGLALKDIAFDYLMKNHGDKASTSMMQKYMSTKANVQPTKSMLMNPKLPDDVLDKVDPSQYSFVRRSKLKPHHMDKLVDHFIAGNGGDRTLRELKDQLSSDNLHKLITQPDSYLGETDKTIIDAKNFDKSHHAAMVNNLSNIQNPYIKRGVMNYILKNSKFADVEDAHHLPGNSMYSNLLENPHIGEEVHKKLKKEMMNNAIGGVPERRNVRYMGEVYGFNDMGDIPKTISKHLTSEDYDKLSEHNYNLTFEDKNHSNKFLDANFKRAKNLDKQISEKIAEGNKKYKDFDPTEDADVRTLKERLHNHMTNYASNIDGHIDKHVRDDEYIGVKDFGEHEKTLNRLSGSDEPTSSIDWLDHYKTPKHLTHDDEENEHYTDNFLDLGIRLHDLKRNTRL